LFFSTTLKQARAAGGKIAFVSNRDGNREIYIMNPDGSTQVNVTLNPSDDTDPSWSPDGARIAFAANRDGVSDIYVMDTDGNAVRRLTTNALPQGLAWSPDGSKIAFGSFQTGTKQIYVMSANGSGQVSLGAPGEFPDWSPDAAKIVWRRAGGFCCNLWTMNADGSGQTQLTSTDDGGARWSPDGTRIAYHSDIARSGHPQIYLIHPDGTSPSGLTTSADNDSPDWSPDGTQIVFVSNRDGNRQLYVMNRDGTAQARITFNAANDEAPVWGPSADNGGGSTDRLCPCSGPPPGGLWKNHGQYVSCVAKAAEASLRAGSITEDEKNAIVEAAAESGCGKR